MTNVDVRAQIHKVASGDVFPFATHERRVIAAEFRSLGVAYAALCRSAP